MSPTLPIVTIIPEVKKKLLSCNLLILQAPPGAGKSTVLPAQLLEEKWLNGKKILMLEPRRLAARSVAARMAHSLNVEVGKTIGYRIRFDSKVSSETRIEVVTEGIVTRMLQTDNLLEEYGLIIFDEFHERSLHADLAFALCYQIQQLIRSDLRILIMSATLNGDHLSLLLNNAPVIKCEGRQFPVIVNYMNTPTDEYLPLSITRAIGKALSENDGDLLVFLPGAAEIQRTATLLEEDKVQAMVHCLYGDLPQQQQQLAILPDPNGRRKIILSTSIAETSLTIEGVRVVIDSGYSRMPRFDLRTGLTRLETVRVTKDAADQRTGRAGRMGPGICYRLWSEGTHMHLNAQRNPEILDADLSPLLLELFQWGIKDPGELTWITMPPAAAIRQANEVLQQLGAIQNNKITERGKAMLRLPAHPRIAHMLMEALEEDKKTRTYRTTALATDIIALLEERNPLQKEAGADLSLRIEVMRKWRNKERVQADRNSLERAERTALSWRKSLDIGIDNSIPADEETGKLIAAAYPERIAKQFNKNNLRYRLTNGHIVRLSENDPLIREEWLAVAHLDAGRSEGRIFLAAPLNPSDLFHLAQMKEVVSWDTEKGMIVGNVETYIGNITLERSVIKTIPEQERIRLLCEAIRREGLVSMLEWTADIVNWQKRMMSIRIWRPMENWPEVSDQHLLDTLENWLAPFLTNVNKREELKRLDISIILQGNLPYHLSQKLNTCVPVGLKVPSGSVIRLSYFSDGSAPEMSVRLQELFGLLETPSVNEGKNKIILHLLSPARRPVQVTQDLPSFWERTYPEIRKQLRIRYPRHSWPEDPRTAQAVKGPVKRK